MNLVYVYLTLLLLNIFFVINIIFSSYNNGPKKIKTFCTIVSLGLILRYLGLLFTFIMQNIEHIYNIRYLISLNIIGIPGVLLLSYYIFLRKDGLKINFIFIILGLLIIMYIGIIKFVQVSFEIHPIYGYAMKYIEQGWINIGYIFILSLILFMCIISYGVKNSIESGIIMVMVSVMIIIGENILILLGFNLDYNTLIGELVSLITLYYGIKSLKKR